jgi:glycosyltransferase involved in cell wall biosynthesis
MVSRSHGRKEASVSQPAVSIVIPVYNEEAIIEQNLAALAGFFDTVVGAGEWLFIMVDNGSSDATPEKVQAAIERWPLSRVVNLSEPNYGAALRAGLTSAVTRWVYLLDIEQWDLPFLAWSWTNRDSYDLFLASKRSDPTINAQTPYRRFLSCCLNGLLQALLGFSGTDTHGPKLIDRSSLGTIIELCRLDRGQFDTELVLRAIRAQKRILEVPVAYSESRPHRNWMIKKIAWNLIALRRLVKVMRDVPYEGLIRYHRLGREDILGERETAPAVVKYDVV